MEQTELNVEVRNLYGKGPARRLRMAKKIPAVFYGPRMKDAISMSVDQKELSLALANTANPLFTLKAQGGVMDGKMAMIRDRQYHPVTGNWVHVDFYEIQMDQEIRVSVKISITGKSKGVTEGGILELIRREIEVHCLPTNIPDKIEVDVTELNIHDSLHVNDVKLPEGARVAGDLNYTIVAVVPPEKEEVVAAPVEGAEGEAAAAGDAAPAAAGAEAAKAPEKAPEAKKD